MEAKQADLRATLLRIDGAIQVLEEELASASMTMTNVHEPRGNAAKAGSEQGNEKEAGGCLE